MPVTPRILRAAEVLSISTSYIVAGKFVNEEYTIKAHES